MKSFSELFFCLGQGKWPEMRWCAVGREMLYVVRSSFLKRIRNVVYAAPTLPNDGVVISFCVDEKTNKVKQMVLLCIDATKLHTPTSAVVRVNTEFFILAWDIRNRFIRILTLTAKILNEAAFLKQNGENLGTSPSIPTDSILQLEEN